jgi:hypothetical protein
MSVMNALGYAAAAILLLELLVVVILFAGIAGGLAFGLHWVNGKTAWAFEKVNVFPPKVRQYVHVGTSYVGKPFILLNTWMDRVESTFGSLRAQVHDAREQASRATATSARATVMPTMRNSSVVRVAQETVEGPAVQETVEMPAVQETTEISVVPIYSQGEAAAGAHPVSPPPPTDPLV